MNHETTTKSELIRENKLLKSTLKEVERKRGEHELAEYVERFQSLAELSITLSGDPIDIFTRIAEMIGKLFVIPIVCLSEIRGDKLFFLSVCNKGKMLIDVGECPISITPCSTVIDSKDICIYQNVMEKFPKASFLKIHNAFSYCGFPSLDSEGNVISVTCLLDDKPHEYSSEDKDLLHMFAQRIGVEMERRNYITEHKRAEEEIRKLTHAIEHSSATVVITDTEGNIEYANPKFTQLTGYSLEEAMGKNPRVLKSGKTPPEVYKELWKNITSGKEWRGEFCNKKKNRELYWERASISPVRNPEGVITNFIAIKDNITEMKKAEEILLEQKKTLEQKNIALSEILGQIEIEKKQIKDNVIINAETLLLPIIQKLKLTGESRKYVQLLQKNLQELTSSFGTTLIKKRAKLTSREIEICNMIKNGLTSKEIASLLNISLRTAEKHRINIRSKLGIINKDLNLASFLQTL